MRKCRYYISVPIIILCALLLSYVSGCGPIRSSQTAGELSAWADKPLNLLILHVNDTHSKLDPALVKLKLDIGTDLKGKDVLLELGGFANLAGIVAKARARFAASLFLHGGDFFQGTLYFTKYEGAADTDFFNLMKLDAATLGNHDFDRGPEILYRNLLSMATFNVVDANVDISGEKLIPDKSRLLRYAIKEIGETKVGLIGLTTTETVHISSPGKHIKFMDTVVSVQKAASELVARGVNKIILISHQGYREDIELAAVLSHVDVIVGGHSHTLLGDFERVGLKSAGPYPTVVADKDGNTVLVLQAWEWAKAIGRIEVAFDAIGKVTGWKADQRLLAGDKWIQIHDLPNLCGKLKRVRYSPAMAEKPAIAEYDGKNWRSVADDPVSETDQYDAYRNIHGELLKTLAALPVSMVNAQPDALKKLAFYSKGVSELREQVVATAGQDLIRGLNTGSGPIVADSMRIKTGARIALNNPGDVRTDINRGPISVEAIYELLPFGNTLVTLELKGEEVVQAIEDAVDFAVNRFGPDPLKSVLYVSGIKFSLKMSARKGERIRDVVVLGVDGRYRPIEPALSYICVVNSYMAAGGDKNDTLKAAGGRCDTGFNDAGVFLEYVTGKTLMNAGERIHLVN